MLDAKTIESLKGEHCFTASMEKLHSEMLRRLHSRDYGHENGKLLGCRFKVELPQAIGKLLSKLGSFWRPLENNRLIVVSVSFHKA